MDDALVEKVLDSRGDGPDNVRSIPDGQFSKPRMMLKRLAFQSSFPERKCVEQLSTGTTGQRRATVFTSGPSEG